MFAIIKAMEDYGKGVSGSTVAGLLLQNSPSSSFFPGQRDILLDFRLKDPSLSFQPCERDINEEVSSTKEPVLIHSPERNILQEQQMRMKDVRQFLSLGPLRELDDPGRMKEDAFSFYSQRDIFQIKDDPAQYLTFHREMSRDDSRGESPPQFHIEEEPVIMDRDSQDKESTTTFIIRKDPKTDRLELKEYDGNSPFSTDQRIILPDTISMQDTEASFHIDQRDIIKETSSFLSPRIVMQEQTRIKSTSSFSVAQEQPHLKISSLPFALEHEQMEEKSSSMPFSHVQEPMRTKTGSPSFAVIQDQIRLKSGSPILLMQDQGRGKCASSPFPLPQKQSRIKNTSSPFSLVHEQIRMKNVSSPLDTAREDLIEQEIQLRDAPFSSPSKIILQDSMHIKDSHTPFHIVENNLIQEQGQIKESILYQSMERDFVHDLARLKNTGYSPSQSVLHEHGKIKHYSSLFNNDRQKRYVVDERHAKESNLQQSQCSALEAQLKGMTSPYNHSLEQDAGKNSPYPPALRDITQGQTIIKLGSNLSSRSLDINPPERDKATPPFNHQSVIAQVGVDCKVCTLCRTSFNENGFLNEEDSCSLCLNHMDHDMKCICTKEDRCTCVEKRYRCAYCSEMFPSTLLLQKHTFNHIQDNTRDASTSTVVSNTQSKSFVCAVCNASFTTQTNLQIHMRSHKETYCSTCDRSFKYLNTARHSCKAKFLCNLCGTGFASNYNLKMHLLKHSGSLPYKCIQCGKSFTKPSELSKHNLVHSGERPYTCDECGMSFTTSTNLRNHKNTHSGVKPYSCHVCSKNFTRPADVKRHMLTHTGARPYACEFCGLAFADASNMRKHFMTHSKPQQGHDIKTYHCTYCSKLFSRPSELKRHLFTHTNTRPYSCHICGLAFTDSSNLKKHIQTHTRATDHRCLQCDKGCKSFDDLEIHVASSHSSSRLDPTGGGHTCQTCGAVFTHLIDLQDHELSHGTARTYQCEICSKNFSQQIFLERHLLTHTESRPYTCSECLKSFKSLSHLRSHNLIHIGEKTHVCLICNKSFLKKSSLRRHQGVHAREKVHTIFQVYA